MKARQAVLAVVLLGGVSATAVLAQGLGGFEPNQFPAVQGKVAQYSLTPRGDVDGLILDDGTEVHLPPHLGAQLVFTVKPGDQVTVRGLKARDIPTVDAASVTNDATHQTVTDNGPPGPGGPTLQASGQIKAQLHGPRGDLNGVLLQDGTIIHLPPDQAQQIAAQLAVGQPRLGEPARQGYRRAADWSQPVTACPDRQSGPGPRARAAPTAAPSVIGATQQRTRPCRVCSLRDQLIEVAQCIGLTLTTYPKPSERWAAS
jgi:hypothetical protein